jgi:hypothetical protein
MVRHLLALEGTEWTKSDEYFQRVYCQPSSAVAAALARKDIPACRQTISATWDSSARRVGRCATEYVRLCSELLRLRAELSLLSVK